MLVKLLDKGLIRRFNGKSIVNVDQAVAEVFVKKNMAVIWVEEKKESEMESEEVTEKPVVKTIVDAICDENIFPPTILKCGGIK